MLLFAHKFKKIKTMDEKLTNQAEQRNVPETQATPEVQDAITEIEATESAILEHSGATGQELTNKTDQYLVDHAERATDLDVSDKEDIVEIALVEGALEVTGERPEANENPIITLEKDGYDQQVTDGVKKLHEEGATLPDGESAAEVVVATLEAQGIHQEEPDTTFNTESQKGRLESIGENRVVVSDQLDMAIQYYVNGASKKDVLEHTGLDPSVLTEHIRCLPNEEADYLKGLRRKSLDKNIPTPTQEASTREISELSTAELESAFVYGIQEDKNITQEQLDKWYDSLPDDEQKRLAEGKQEMSQHAERINTAEVTVEHNLERTSPELLKGRLPQGLANRIGSEYVIGLRQLGNYEAEEAQEQLDADGGVDVSNLGLIQSFNVIKPSDDTYTTKGIVIKGYYGANAGGKFVIAVPMAEGVTDPTQAYDSIPDMHRELESSDNPDFSAVNPKYVAGFIDGEGIFYPNENFMQSSEPKLTRELSLGETVT